MESKSMIRLYDIKLIPGQGEDSLKDVVCKTLKCNKGPSFLKQFKISKKSIDARKKNNIVFVYSVDFTIGGGSEEKFIDKVTKKNRNLKIKRIHLDDYSPMSEYRYRRLGTNRTTPVNISERPVITGAGPAGLFAGLILAYNGLAPIIIERGKEIDERIKDVAKFWGKGLLDPESNPLFGEGGAGTFSDGKLTTGKKDERISYILREFYEAGASKEILYVNNPHIGSDVLRKVVKNIRKKIIGLGGEIHFGILMKGLHIENFAIKSVLTERGGKSERISTENLILAIGHSARDSYKKLYEQGVLMEQKPFSIGLRIEHRQDLIDRSQYGHDFEKIYKMSISKANMPPSEYKLSYKTGDKRGVYTFCMCPGGEIITTAAEPETLSVNGMSNKARNGSLANSALLVDVRTIDYGNDHPLAGIDFQRKYERKAFVAGGSDYRAPSESVKDFMADNSLIAGCLPEFAVRGIREALTVFGKKIKGFDDENAILKGIESGSSSPVRILRDKTYKSNIGGLYPCGEGAGYAGGIISSAIDGIKCAEAVMKTIDSKSVE